MTADNIVPPLLKKRSKKALTVAVNDQRSSVLILHALFNNQIRYEYFDCLPVNQIPECGVRVIAEGLTMEGRGIGVEEAKINACVAALATLKATGKYYRMISLNSLENNVNSTINHQSLFSKRGGFAGGHLGTTRPGLITRLNKDFIPVQMNGRGLFRPRESNMIKTLETAHGPSNNFKIDPQGVQRPSRGGRIYSGVQGPSGGGRINFIFPRLSGGEGSGGGRFQKPFEGGRINSGVQGPPRGGRINSGVQGPSRGGRIYSGVQESSRGGRTNSGVQGASRGGRINSGVQGSSRGGRITPGVQRLFVDSRINLRGVRGIHSTMISEPMPQPGSHRSRLRGYEGLDRGRAQIHSKPSDLLSTAHIDRLISEYEQRRDTFHGGQTYDENECWQDPTYGESTYGDQTYEDQTCEDGTYEDLTYEDQTYEDPTYIDQTYEDEAYEDPTYGDQTYTDQTYVDPTYEDQTYEDQICEYETYIDPNYIDLTYGNQTYEDGTYEDQTYGDQTYKDQTYRAQTYGDQTYGNQTYEDETYEDPTYIDQTYEDQTYGGQTYGDQTYEDLTYGDETYGDQTYEDGTYGDQTYEDGTYEDGACAIRPLCIGGVQQIEGRSGIHFLRGRAGIGGRQTFAPRLGLRGWTGPRGTQAARLRLSYMPPHLVFNR